jgi:hypothetical protein
MKTPIRAAIAVSLLFCFAAPAAADVRVKQKVTTGGQTFETTRSIKGSRERTEQRMETADPQMAAYFPQIATVTQCDLKRTVRLNDRKQLFMVEPFADTADAPVTRTTPAPTRTTTRRGGTMTVTVTIKDTGERKMMFGLQARHLIITQEMESSPDACNGPSRSKFETDGWYVDFSADFNCPTRRPEMPTGAEGYKPDCLDRYVYKGNGSAAKLGFLLQGTMRIYGPDGSVQTSTTTETLELSRAALEASLFDIPAGYKEAASSQELYAISLPGTPDMAESPARSGNRNTGIPPATPVMKSVAVSVSVAGGGSPGTQAQVEQYMREQIAARGLRAVTGSGDYTLDLQFAKIKESAASKIGGFLGKATGTSTSGVGKVDIDLTATLSGAASGVAKVKNKFDGPLEDAVRAAVDQALGQLLDRIQ